jgi:membrane dipeptidase
LIDVSPVFAGGDCCGHGTAGRRAFLAGALAVVAAACAGPSTEAAQRRERELLRQGAATIRDLVAIDLHAHPGGFHRPRVGELPLRALADMRAGGVRAALFAVSTDGPVIRREGGRFVQYREPEPGQLHANAREALERVHARARQGRVRTIGEAGDLARLGADGVPGALLAFEGGDALEGQPARVAEFHALGLRSIQLVHYRVNELGDIQTEPARHGGLTDAGRAVIAEMNRLGMVVDGAHASPDTLTGILEASRAPILVSHTGPAALRPSIRRHLSDASLRAVGARGGLVGIWPLAPTGAGIGHLVAEVDYVRRLIGVEHVGVGTDMDGIAGYSVIANYRAYPPLPAALLARGFSEADARLVLGGNFARLYRSAA